MNIDRISTVRDWLLALANRFNAQNIPVQNGDVIRIRENILLISKDIENEYSILGERLLKAKDRLFNEVPTNWNAVAIFINPFVVGQAIEILTILQEQYFVVYDDRWAIIHPEIRKVSEKLYMDGSYANAACDAFIEINDRVKKLFIVLNPTAQKVPDGDAAMTTVFSTNAPMIELGDCSIETGYNTQKGFMQMLAGAMSALRNPKAHANISLDQADAMRQLMFASMLMYKIDEAVNKTDIQE